MFKSNHYKLQRKKLIWKIVGFLLVLVAIYFLGGVILRPASGPLSLVFRPIWWGSEGIFSSGQAVVDLFHDRNKLVVENRRLQEENNNLKIKLLANNQIESNNAYFRSLLGRSKSNDLPVVGGVVFLPNFIPYQTLLIDIGKNNLSRTMRTGDLAVASGKVLVGRVAEIGPWYSKVRLISAEENLSVVVGPKNVPALALGAGAGNFKISLPKDTAIAIGDRVLTPLYNNLLIGTVRNISKNPSQPNQEILIKTPVNLWQLKWLEIYNAKT